MPSLPLLVTTYLLLAQVPVVVLFLPEDLGSVFGDELLPRLSLGSEWSAENTICSNYKLCMYHMQIAQVWIGM